MNLTRVTPPTDVPVSLAEARAHLRIDASDDDAKVLEVVRQATAMVDGWHGIGFALMRQTWRLSLDWFPWIIRVPLGPVISVDSIKYIDTAGTEQTLDPANYHVDLDSDPVRIEPAFGLSWPTTRSQLAAVKVTFTAGHASSSEIPEDVRAALLLTLAHLYENRQISAFGITITEIPLGVRHILDQYRAGRFA